jgi:hypothetical protein
MRSLQTPPIQQEEFGRDDNSITARKRFGRPFYRYLQSDCEYGVQTGQHCEASTLFLNSVKEG